MEDNENSEHHGNHDWLKNPQIDPGNYLLSQETALELDNVVSIMSTYVAPTIACTSLFFTILCVLILSNSAFKRASTLYKYILYNAMVDSVFLSLVAFKPLLEHMLTENIHELFGFIYVTSVILTCSNLIKICFSMDRLARMTGSKVKHWFKRAPWMLTLGALCLSCVLNAPLLIAHNVFEFRWFKLTYFELVLNETVDQGPDAYFLGVFAMIVAIFLDLGLLILLVCLNSRLRKAADTNLRTLSQIIENEKNQGNFVIQILDFDQDINDFDDDDVKEVTLEDMPAPPKTVISNISLERNEKEEDIERSVKQRDRLASLPPAVNIEIARKRLLKLISVINRTFILGHGLFVSSNLFEKIIYFIYGPNKLAIHFNYFAHWDVVNACANLVLYASFSGGFFVYYAYNQRFKYAVKLACRPLLKCFCLKKNAGSAKSETFKQ